MIITYLRSSSYNNWAFCQQQYYIQYVLGHRSKSNKKADLGTICHKALECVASSKLAEQNKQQTFIDDSLGQQQANLDAHYWLPHAYTYYTSKSPNTFDYDEDYKTCSKWVEQAITFRNGLYNPANRTIVAPEHSFDITINEPWATYDYEVAGKRLQGNLAIKGTIDLITQTQDRVFEIVDWKTGARKDWSTGKEKDYDYLYDDPQLLMYYWAAHKCFGSSVDHIILTIFFIRDGGPFMLSFGPNDLVKAEGLIKARFEDIKSCKSPALRDNRRRDWVCQKLCQYSQDNFLNSGTCTCEYIQKEIKATSIEEVTEKYMAKGHQFSQYQAPGA